MLWKELTAYRSPFRDPWSSRYKLTTFSGFQVMENTLKAAS